MMATHFRLEDALGGRAGGIAAQTGGWRLVVRGTVGAGRQPAAFTLRRPVKLRRRLTAFADVIFSDGMNTVYETGCGLAVTAR